MPNTWYVDSGSGTDTGHAAGGNAWGSAFKSVKYAVETIATGSANARAIILISASAKYHEQEICPAVDNLQIKAKVGERIIFDGDKKTSSQPELFELGNTISGTYFENFTILNYNTSNSTLFRTTGNTVRGAIFSLSGVHAYDNVAAPVYTWSGTNGTTSSVGSYEDASQHVLMKDCKFIGNGQNNAAARCVTIYGQYVKLVNCVFTQGKVAYGKLLAGGHNYENTTASFCTFFQTSSTTSGMGSLAALVQIGKAINCAASFSCASSHIDYDVFQTILPVSYSAIATPDSKNALQNIDAGGAVFPATRTVFANVIKETASLNVFKFVDPDNYDFNLSSDSDLINAGALFDNVTVDASGSTRAQRTWTTYSTPAESNFAGTLTINLYNNAAAQYRRPGPPGRNDIGAYELIPSDVYEGTINQVDQVPFSLATKGASGLRKRSIPYCVSKGGDPSTIIETSSV